MIHIITNIRDFLWGYPSLIILGGYGLFITICSKCFSLKALKNFFGVFRNVKGEKIGISPLMSLSTALGGTVGVGSIIGVAYAISVGGAGVLFWMWVSAFLGMMTKFSECALAVKYREKKDDHFVGGTPYILKKSGYGRIALFFAFICVITSFGTGNLTQINGLSNILEAKGVECFKTALFGFFVILFIVIKGQKVIGKANEIMMPITSAIYLLLLLYILLINIKEIPNAIIQIVKDAFGIRAISGGICVSKIINTFRVGFSKGVFSHEAGMGTSPIAHASSNSAEPYTQGIMGIFEVFFDTFIVSTMTGIALLVSGENNVDELFYIYFGDIGYYLFIILLTIFVIAAMISWCFYAESCLHFLTKRKWLTILYRLLFSLCTIIGALMSSSFTWVISDILNIIMIIPNIYILLLKHSEILEIVKYGTNCAIKDNFTDFIRYGKRRA